MTTTAHIIEIHPEASVDAIGLVLTRKSPLSHGAWEDIGRVLGEAANANAWAVGDWLIAGGRLPGNNWVGSGYTHAAAITGLSIKVLGRRYTVAMHYPRETRIEGASWSIHNVCLRIKDVADRRAAIDQAVREGWTTEHAKNVVSGRNAATKRHTRALREVKCPNCEHVFVGSSHKVLA